METRKKGAKRSKAVVETKRSAVSLKIAEKGIVTGHDFAGFMSALMSDLVGGRVSPMVGNAACNAGGKLLKVVEMQMKYGTASASQQGAKVLFLTGTPAPMIETNKVQ
jgi:hypothetical protein